MKPKKTVNVELVPALDNDSNTLAQQIENSISAVPTPKLITFYVQGDVIVKRIKELQDLVKSEIVQLRRDEGSVHGENQQHRRFAVGACELTVEERGGYSINEERAMALVAKKGLTDECIDLLVSSGEAFQKFLRKHRAELKAMEVEVTEVFNPAKFEALVTLKKLTTAEVQSALDRKEKTYALKPKFKK